MHRRLLLLPLLLVVGPQSSAAPPRGHLILIGGGSVPDAARSQALRLAGVERPRVVVLPQASRLEDRGESSLEPWRQAGAGEVLNLDPLDAKARTALERAHVIWMPGGSQERLMDALREAKLIETIRARYAAGAVVAGTSAGAAVGSSQMLTGEASLDAVRPGETKLAPGLGLWEGVIVDQHFVRRQRNNRLLAAVLDNPTLLGVGIDEGTAVVVSGDQVEVLGKGTVLVYDARQAKVSDAKPGQPHGATGLTLHVLRAGMRLPR